MDLPKIIEVAHPGGGHDVTIENQGTLNFPVIEITRESFDTLRAIAKDLTHFDGENVVTYPGPEGEVPMAGKLVLAWEPDEGVEHFYGGVTVLPGYA